MIGIIRLLLSAFMVFVLSYNVNAQNCVPAYDFGQGGTLYVPANPSEDSATSLLIHDTPKSSQVAPWIETQLTTIGQAANANQSNYFQSVVKIYVTGGWSPWGTTTSTGQCPLIDCDPSNPKDSVCLSGGKVVDEGDSQANLPCTLNAGWGLYGLIAKNINGVTYNPNDTDLSLSLPNEYFRTFRVAPLKSDADGMYFELSYTQQCDVDSSGGTVCLVDEDAAGNQVTVQGKLYFKILDSYYEDNTGGYNINVVSGVYSEKGWIQKTVEKFNAVLQKVTQLLYDAMTSQVNFIGMIRALLLLYIIITGLAFMMGLARMHQADFIVRMFKVSIVTMLIGPDSWEFFNKYLFSFFTVGAQSVGNMITEASFQYSGQYGMGLFLLPEDATALAVFDSIVSIILEPAIHKKIVSLLLHKWYFCYIPLIYVSIFILLLGIVESVVLYLISLMNIALLVVVAPIFIVMILFTLTKEFFDGWLKAMLSNGMLLIIIAVAVALMANLVLGQIYRLLYFAVCWEKLQILEIEGIDIFSIYFWFPTDDDQVDNCVTFSNIAALMIIAILMRTFMKQLSTLIDALSGAFMQPITHMRDGVVGAFNSAVKGNALYRAGAERVNMARGAMSPLGHSAKLRKGAGLVKGATEKAGQAFSTRGGIAHGRHRLANKIADKLDEKVGDHTINKFRS